ncbi:MAG: energy transducer TonB [Bdellovibrio sp. CG10_big_fil_rev_8_21_14_0_10_47_8]|nr:MAG: energy transducer TonB [Bdellovibrio sp. CG10_big_fil_rev_8_21_14_0_10_47_8]
MKMTLRRYLTLSLIFHGLFLLITFVIPQWKPAEHEVVELTVLSDEPSPQAKTNPEKLKQVVDQDEKAVNDEIPDTTKFLSQHNQVVKKQTVANQLGQFQNRRQVGPQGSGGKPKLKVTDLTPKMNFEKIVRDHEQKEMQIEKSLDQEAMAVAHKKRSSAESASNPQKGNGGVESSQTTDYLKDVEKGSETLLSSREFVYHTFYSRIRRQLNQFWIGKVRDKLAKIVKEGRSIASTEDHVTKLLITLDRKGLLMKVQVVSDSGVRDLDDAAIEAFKEAAPFPNPPNGIVDPDGTIKIRWDFVLEA